jgi:PAS domain S-box-containing protein
MNINSSPEGINPLQEIQLELDNSRQILKAIFDNTKSSIFLLSPDYTIIFFNKYAWDGSKLLYGRDMKLGDNLLQYRREGDEEIFEAFTENFEQAISTKSVIASEQEMHYPQMSFWVRLEYSPIYEGTTLIGVLLTVLNISDRKKFQIQNEFQHKQLVDIAWSQSHETRQPVSTMLGLINILDKSTLTPDNLHIVKLMEETAHKMDRVIQKVVMLANQISNSKYTS